MDQDNAVECGEADSEMNDHPIASLFPLLDQQQMNDLATAERATKLRKRFESLGWGAEHIRINTQSHNMDSAIFVYINRLDVDIPMAMRISMEAQGTQPKGGNRYVYVLLSEEVRSLLEDRYEAEVQTAIDELEEYGKVSCSPLAPIKGTTWSVVFSGRGYQLWQDSKSGGTAGGTFGDARQGSLEIAIIQN